LKNNTGWKLNNNS